MRFKSLLIFLFLNVYALNSNANGGIFETYIEITIDNAPGFYYGTGGGNPNFNNAVLATNLNPNTQSLEILTRGINTWNDNGTDVQSARLNYRVYKQGDTPGSFITVNLPFMSQTGNDKFWNTNTPPIDLLTNVTLAATYVVEIYWDATTNNVNCGNCSSGILYESNGGNNFIATFTTDSALPVELLSFDVKQMDNITNVRWSTTNEINNCGYIVQHSSDGINYRDIANIKSKSDVCSNCDYQYNHQNSSMGTNYYKLIQKDNDGRMNFLGTKQIIVNADHKIVLYPNPACNEINVSLENHETVDIHFYNMTGRLVLSLPLSKTLNVDRLPSGIYMFKLSDGAFLPQKMVIKK